MRSGENINKHILGTRVLLASNMWNWFACWINVLMSENEVGFLADGLSLTNWLHDLSAAHTHSVLFEHCQLVDIYKYIYIFQRVVAEL